VRRVEGRGGAERGQLIVNLIPRSRFVIGKQPPVQELRADEQRRFQMVFRKSSAHSPGRNTRSPCFSNIAMAGCATSNVSTWSRSRCAARPLSGLPRQRGEHLTRSCARLRPPQDGSEDADIVLAPLARRLADSCRSLHCGRDAARPLPAGPREDRGNPSSRPFSPLAEEGLFAFDADASAGAGTWRCIRAKGYTDNGWSSWSELKRLPDRTQKRSSNSPVSATWPSSPR